MVDGHGDVVGKDMARSRSVGSKSGCNDGRDIVDNCVRRNLILVSFKG